MHIITGRIVHSSSSVLHFIFPVCRPNSPAVSRTEYKLIRPHLIYGYPTRGPPVCVMVSVVAYVNYIYIYIYIYIGLFISPSGISELDYATTKTDTAERSIPIGRESLQVFFLY